MKPEDKKQPKATYQQKAEAHQHLDILWVTIFGKENQKQARSIIYQFWNAVIADKIKQDVSGILNPFDGDAHISKLSPENIGLLPYFKKYLLSKHKGSPDQILSKLNKWLGELRTAYDNPTYTAAKKKEIILAKISTDPLIKEIRTYISEQEKKGLESEAPEVEEPDLTPTPTLATPTAAKPKQKNKSAEQYCLDGFWSYINGDDIEAVKYFRTAANMGNLEAKLYLSACYEFEIGGLKNNSPEKIELLKEAARFDDPNMSSGLPDAQYTLGMLFLKGYGIKKDPATAFKLFSAAKDQGSIRGQVALALCYEKGVVELAIKPNLEEAFRLMEDAAKKGDKIANYNIARFYEYGIGTKTNQELAIRFYTESANQGLTTSKACLGAIYHTINKLDLAFKWHQEAAKEGDGLAQYNLGELYVSKNKFSAKFKPEERIKEAIFWYQKASDQNIVLAQEKLGDIFLTAGDKANAVGYYNKAAENGSSKGQISVAKIFLDVAYETQDLNIINMVAKFLVSAKNQAHPEADGLIAIFNKNPKFKVVFDARIVLNKFIDLVQKETEKSTRPADKLYQSMCKRINGYLKVSQISNEAREIFQAFLDKFPPEKEVAPTTTSALPTSTPLSKKEPSINLD